MASNPEYLLHYIARLQKNNFDALTIVSGDKGSGKSSATIYLAREYIKKFGFVCPHCGHEFFKNIYGKNFMSNGEPYFEIPEYILRDETPIECPIEYELNMKTGEEEKKGGCGKTFKYSERKKIQWKAEKFIAYDNADVVDKIFSLPKYSPLIADEAVRFAAAMNHNKAESKYLKQLFAVIRPKGFWIFFNIPEMQWIDSKYREAMSSFWLRMIERGRGVLFEKDKGEAKEKYHMKELQQIMGTIKFFTPMDKIKKNLKKHPCYFDMFSFPELPKKVYNDYEKVRNAINLKRQVEEMQLSNKDLAKVMTWNIMNNWDRIKIAIDKSKQAKPTYDMMSREVIVDPVTRKSMASEPTIRNWLKGVEDYVKSKGKNATGFDGKVVGDSVEKDNGKNKDSQEPKKKQSKYEAEEVGEISL